MAVPKALDEALVTVPLVRALKAVRRDMQVNVICPSAQAGVWKAVPEVTHVLPHDSLNQLREALAADEFYNDGPLDLGVMLDQDMETLKALEEGQKPMTPYHLRKILDAYKYFQEQPL